MAKTVASGFDEFLSRLTPTNAQVVAASTHRATVEAALMTGATLQRFFQSGSFSNGTGVRYHSDVDYFASLKAQPGASTTALHSVRSILQARFSSTPVYVRRPAVIVQFGSDGSEKYEVVPAYLKSGTGNSRVYEIAGVDGGWMKASPDAHLAYVRSIDQGVGGRAKWSRPEVRRGFRSCSELLGSLGLVGVDAVE